MIDPTPRASDLEAGLAEIDRRLRLIQDELAEDDRAAAGAPSAARPQSTKPQGRSGPLEAVLQRSSRPGTKTGAEQDREQVDDLKRQVEALTDLRDKLLTSIRELLDGYQALVRAQPSPSERTRTQAGGDVTLSVGPFDSLDAVHAFERAVATLPGVRDTSLRGYEGEDRAIVDVRLGVPNAAKLQAVRPRSLRVVSKPISFARGAPSLDIIDVEGLRAAAEQAFTADPAGATAYGTSVGYLPLRAWLAERHGVDPTQVLVTNGSMQADAFLFDALVQSGDAVIVERPTYDRTLLALRERGADVRMVELAPDGIDVAALERLLASVDPTLAHIIPNFQNPAGYTLSAEKRHALVELAGAHGFTIFEDDPYGALRFEGETLPTMFSIGGDTVVYASSFSKTVCPGIRVGDPVGPADLIARVAKIATGTYISPSMVSQAIVHQFCQSGALERSIETVKAALGERARTLCAALERALPDARFVMPQGGYFLWVDLPRGTDVNALFETAKQRGVQFVKGSDFVLEGEESSLRLAYSGVTPAEIEEGVSRLAEAYAEVGPKSAEPAADRA